MEQPAIAPMLPDSHQLAAFGGELVGIWEGVVFAACSN